MCVSSNGGCRASGVSSAAFCRTYGTDIFEDWRVGPSFKMRFETAFWLEPVATATGIATGAQRQF
ncbi:hypothetical protein DY78_GL002859 [Lactiplantibacillus fabifermentans DSM 21115]|uniref:Uncharacterized protein n=1 Tax=Lactiplantibacillus fabifermentans DSM 21115 TaxID=1413187 RepID=A0A0R2NQ86_9LACO|nr:hypothetical protein DY78_GL002859 [Lactiplantibacillus fabifermentans DSM 21115]